MKTVYLNADKVVPVGSRITCAPAPTDTDIDRIVLFQAILYGNMV